MSESLAFWCKVADSGDEREKQNQEQGGDILSIEQVEVLIQAQQEWEKNGNMSFSELAALYGVEERFIASIVTLSFNIGFQTAVRLQQGYLNRALRDSTNRL